MRWYWLNDLNNDNLKEEVLKELKDIFENVNRWLQFAEAKNGALIGINGVFLFKSVDFLFDIINGKLNGSKVLVTSSLLIFSVAMIIALKSFLPNTGVFEDKEVNEEIQNINENNMVLIFFEDICKYESSKLYLKDIYQYFFYNEITEENLSRRELDYAKEILINSRIASYKYKLFKRAIKLNFIAIILWVPFLVLA